MQFLATDNRQYPTSSTLLCLASKLQLMLMSWCMISQEEVPWSMRVKRLSLKV